MQTFYIVQHSSYPERNNGEEKKCVSNRGGEETVKKRNKTKKKKQRKQKNINKKQELSNIYNYRNEDTIVAHQGAVVLEVLMANHNSVWRQQFWLSSDPPFELSTDHLRFWVRHQQHSIDLTSQLYKHQ